MANFGDIPSDIKLLPHQSVRRNLVDNEVGAELRHSNRLLAEPGVFRLRDRGGFYEAYATDREDVVVRVRSSDYAGGLTKGTVVYIGGAQGNRPYVLKADADTEATSSKTFGMLAEDIPANGDGLCAINGVVSGLALPTASWADGDLLWLSSTAGEFQKTSPPAEPAHAVFIGYVTRAHPTLGTIVLQIKNGYELDELHGVSVSTPADRQVLAYENSSGLWKNAEPGLRVLQVFTTDANGDFSSTVDAYSYTVPANTLTVNGESLHAVYGGTVSRNQITSVEVMFAGTSIFYSDEISLIGDWRLDVDIVRVDSTTARCTVGWLYRQNAYSAEYTLVSTGLDFGTSEILKLRLYAEDAGTDITARMGKVWKLGAA